MIELNTGNCKHFYHNGLRVWPCKVLDSQYCARDYIMVITHFWKDGFPVHKDKVIARDDKRLDIKHTKKGGYFVVFRDDE